MSETLNLPEGSTVTAGEDSIRFTDREGNTGDITEYGVVMDEEVATTAEGELSTGEPEFVEPPIRDAAFDPTFENIRTANHIYGFRGQVSKRKK